jgi:hypothetical protein
MTWAAGAEVPAARSKVYGKGAPVSSRVRPHDCWETPGPGLALLANVAGYVPAVLPDFRRTTDVPAATSPTRTVGTIVRNR